MNPYTTPPGFRDTPFIYVYDPWPLVDASWTDTGDFVSTGKAFQNLNLATLYGEQFILRRVNPSFMTIGPVAVTDPPGGFRMRDARNRDRFSGPRPLIATDLSFLGNVMNCSLPILPEMLYPVRGQINFDLFGVGLARNYTGVNAVPLSQLLFQGVRRFPYGAPDNRLLAAGWEQRPYCYPIDINIDWLYWSGGIPANGQNPPVRFTIPISDWDFELLEIRTIRDGTSAVEGGTDSECAQIVLYDWAQVALMSAPVNLHAINSADNSGLTDLAGSIYADGYIDQTAPGGGIGGTAGAGALCPPLLYPNRSSIIFDLWSMLDVNGPASHTITIQFVGRRRWPSKRSA